ncbi:hypothetical protein [Streptomyces sp. NPDC093261]|uniref:hypothetical protein n=1 Tax=Streptomyces sp. NPDC093261 TaxID=3366037 RepID=UPI00380BF26F
MLTLDLAAGTAAYAAGWLLTARATYRRLLRIHRATWKRHAEEVRAGQHREWRCTENQCQWRYHLGPMQDPSALAPAAMGAALAWPLWTPIVGLTKAVVWQRPTPETPDQAAKRLERELEAEFGTKE